MELSDFLACIDQTDSRSIESAGLSHPQAVVWPTRELNIEGLAALIASARTQVIAVPSP